MIIVSKKPVLILFCILVCIGLFLLISFPVRMIYTISNSAYTGYTVVLDAGHGGMDGGCSGPDGTLEKELNLDITLRLSELFKLSGINVVLTREDDSSTGDSVKFIKNKDIKARIETVNVQKKPILISIHMNKFPQSQYKGSQIFYGKEKSSKSFAELVQNNIKTYLQKDNNRKAKPVPSDVLLFKRVSAPTILCECGFLSNTEELANLKSGEYRQRIALLIYTSALTYLSAQN